MMNRERLLKLICMIFALSCFIVTSTAEAQEWAVEVISINVADKAVDEVNDVLIIDPGKDKVRMGVLSKGQKIKQGTEIVVPRRTVLVFKSANGNSVRLQPGSRFKINMVSGKGETHTLQNGQASFNVMRLLDFFNVNYESFVASVRGTEFEMAVEPEKEIRFHLKEGKLVVQREVKVKILENKKIAKLTASEMLEKGKKTQVSYRLGVFEYLEEFKTFKDAEDYYRRQLQEDEKSGQYERIHDGRTSLGSILVMLGKPKDAIDHYEQALKAARERYDEWGEAIALNYIGVAYYHLGESRKAIDYFEKSLTLKLKRHPDGIHLSIARSYNNLGMAYNELYEYSKAIDYLDKSLELCLRLYSNKDSHMLIAANYLNLWYAHKNIGHYRQANEYFEKSRELSRQLLPNWDHKDSTECYEMLMELTKSEVSKKMLREIGAKLIKFERPCFVEDGKLVNFSACKKIAEAGIKEAQQIIGMAYDEGLDVPKDYTQAIFWYRKAADQNWVPAMFRLGEMYEQGLGVNPNPKEAASWYLKSARLAGHPNSLNHLGRMYSQGLGVQQDNIEAFKWFLISTTSSWPEAIKVADVELNKLDHLLEAQQIVVACQRAKDEIKGIRDPMIKLFMSDRFEKSDSSIGVWCRGEEPEIIFEKKFP